MPYFNPIFDASDLRITVRCGPKATVSIRNKIAHRLHGHLILNVSPEHLDALETMPEIGLEIEAAAELMVHDVIDGIGTAWYGQSNDAARAHVLIQNIAAAIDRHLEGGDGGHGNYKLETLERTVRALVDNKSKN